MQVLFQSLNFQGDDNSVQSTELTSSEYLYRLATLALFPLKVFLIKSEICRTTQYETDYMSD